MSGFTASGKRPAGVWERADRQDRRELTENKVLVVLM
jgi:hypothetical protein